MSETQPGDAQAIIDHARLSVEPVQIDPEKTYAVAMSHGVVVLDTLSLRDRPTRKAGTATLADATSFIEYVKKHELATETEIFADLEKASVAAVINSHASDEAGWGDHRATLVLAYTPAWQAWTKSDRKMLGQVEFAEHIEDRVVDIVRPSGAEMLELAQTFQAKTKVSFESSKRLASGEQQLQYVEESTASAGRKGDITIPDTFDLGLAPYVGGAPFKVTARLRYRMTEGTLRLGYFLDRPEDVLRAAFEAVVESIAQGVSSPVFIGRA